MLPESRLQTKLLILLQFLTAASQQPAPNTTIRLCSGGRLPTDTCPDARLYEEVSEYSTQFVGNF